MVVMRSVVPAVLLAVLVTGWSSGSTVGSEVSAPVATDMTIDTGHSSVVFRCLHLGVSPFWGTFGKVSGSVAIDDARLEDAKVNIVVDTSTVDSRNSGRDKHLLGPDFFNVKQFPTATFESTAVEKKADNRYTVKGRFTLVGKTKVITIEAVRIGAKDVGGRFGFRAGYEVDFSIKRSDHGMAYGVERGMISDEVRIILGLEMKTK